MNMNMPKWKKCGNFLAKTKTWQFWKNGKNTKIVILGNFFEFVDFQKYKRNFWGAILRKVFEYLVKWWKLWVTNYVPNMPKWKQCGHFLAKKWQKQKKWQFWKNGKKHQNCDFGQLLLIYWFSKIFRHILSGRFHIEFSRELIFSICLLSKV